MNAYKRLRRQQLLRQAEGYLDLIMVFADQWPPTPAARDRVAQRAIDSLDAITEPGAHQADIFYLRGQALRAMQRYDEAVYPLRESARHNPDNIHVWLALGWCYKRCGRLDLAIESLEEALSVDRSQAILHYNLACYWSLARNVRSSVEYLAEAFELDPNYRDLVGRESDFDPIRNHPEFVALTSVIV